MLNEAYRAESRRRAREQFDREYGGSEASSSGEPSPYDSLGIERAARAEWERSASVRLEFGDSFERYLAFVKADRKGLVRIISRKN